MTSNALQRALLENGLTIEEAQAFSDQELLDLPRIGVAVLEEIRSHSADSAEDHENIPSAEKATEAQADVHTPEGDVKGPSLLQRAEEYIKEEKWSGLPLYKVEGLPGFQTFEFRVAVQAAIRKYNLR